jgi:hypothetical protein
LLAGILAWTACHREDDLSSMVLMRIGDRIVTVDEYQRDFKLYRTAADVYPDEDAAVNRDLQIRFVGQLVDQLVLLEHARTLAIDVSDRELATAFEAIQSDYPDDVFEQLLLENAITVEQWKASLRNRLIIERVIRQELEENVRIGEEDMAQFMAQLHQDRSKDAPGQTVDTEQPAPTDESIVDQLRRSKTEVAYTEWMAALKKKYPVEINQNILNEVLAPEGDAAQSAGRDIPQSDPPD